MTTTQIIILVLLATANIVQYFTNKRQLEKAKIQVARDGVKSIMELHESIYEASQHEEKKAKHREVAKASYHRRKKQKATSVVTVKECPPLETNKQ